jgi:hypothetical protein
VMASLWWLFCLVVALPCCLVRPGLNVIGLVSTLCCPLTGSWHAVISYCSAVLLVFALEATMLCCYVAPCLVVVIICSVLGLPYFALHGRCPLLLSFHISLYFILAAVVTLIRASWSMSLLLAISLPRVTLVWCSCRFTFSCCCCIVTTT